MPSKDDFRKEGYDPHCHTIRPVVGTGSAVSGITLLFDYPLIDKDGSLALKIDTNTLSVTSEGALSVIGGSSSGGGADAALAARVANLEEQNKYTQQMLSNITASQTQDEQNIVANRNNIQTTTDNLKGLNDKVTKMLNKYQEAISKNAYDIGVLQQAIKLKIEKVVHDTSMTGDGTTSSPLKIQVNSPLKVVEDEAN